MPKAKACGVATTAKRNLRSRTKALAIAEKGFPVNTLPGLPTEIMEVIFQVLDPDSGHLFGLTNRRFYSILVKRYFSLYGVTYPAPVGQHPAKLRNFRTKIQYLFPQGEYWWDCMLQKYSTKYEQEESCAKIRALGQAHREREQNRRAEFEALHEAKIDAFEERHGYKMGGRYERLSAVFDKMKEISLYSAKRNVRKALREGKGKLEDVVRLNNKERKRPRRGFQGQYSQPSKKQKLSKREERSYFKNNITVDDISDSEILNNFQEFLDDDEFMHSEPGVDWEPDEMKGMRYDPDGFIEPKEARPPTPEPATVLEFLTQEEKHKADFGYWSDSNQSLTHKRTRFVNDSNHARKQREWSKTKGKDFRSHRHNRREAVKTREQGYTDINGVQYPSDDTNTEDEYGPAARMDVLNGSLKPPIKGHLKVANGESIYDVERLEKNWLYATDQRGNRGYIDRRRCDLDPSSIVRGKDPRTRVAVIKEWKWRGPPNYYHYLKKGTYLTDLEDIRGHWWATDPAGHRAILRGSGFGTHFLRVEDDQYLFEELELERLAKEERGYDGDEERYDSEDEDTSEDEMDTDVGLNMRVFEDELEILQQEHEDELEQEEQEDTSSSSSSSSSSSQDELEVLE